MVEQNRQELLEHHAIKDTTGIGVEGEDGVLDPTDVCAGLDPDLVSDGVLFLGLLGLRDQPQMTQTSFWRIRGHGETIANVMRSDSASRTGLRRSQLNVPPECCCSAM